jgi:hypothetical protein
VAKSSNRVEKYDAGGSYGGVLGEAGRGGVEGWRTGLLEVSRSLACVVVLDIKQQQVHVAKFVPNENEHHKNGG